MNCQQAEKQITIAVFGKLNENQESELSEHLSQCAECRHRWEQTAPWRRQENRITRVHLPDPDRSWTTISERLSNRSRKPGPGKIWRLVPATAVLMIVFFVGLFFGRRLFFTPPDSQMPWPMALSEVSLETYAEFLQPILVNFSNQDGVKNPAVLRRLESRIISDLLAQTRLLKSLVTEDVNTALRELLQDLEFILTAMDNLEPGDTEASRHLAGMIRDNEVSLRVHQLIRNQNTF
jgi:hypothetical protein